MRRTPPQSTPRTASIWARVDGLTVGDDGQCLERRGAEARGQVEIQVLLNRLGGVGTGDEADILPLKLDAQTAVALDQFVGEAVQAVEDDLDLHAEGAGELRGVDGFVADKEQAFEGGVERHEGAASGNQPAIFGFDGSLCGIGWRGGCGFGHWVGQGSSFRVVRRACAAPLRVLGWGRIAH